MMKSIYQLEADLYDTIKRKGWCTDASATALGKSLQRAFNAEHLAGKLRLSQMGPRCPKALWLSIHHPELAEALPPWAEFKYSYGHIIEAMAIELAKASGHSVEGEQDEISVDGVLGHRDCLIDGCLVDVKSSSSMGFEKFVTGRIATNDDFGYLDQLDGYSLGSSSDPLMIVKDKAYLLAIDKQLGKIKLYEHHTRPERIKARIAAYKAIVERTTAPTCECGTTTMGESGNIGLDLQASYNVFKHSCFPHLRTFLYSRGPVYLVRCVKRPWNKDGPITEVDKHGKIVYN